MEQKRVSFSIAKAIKNSGYPQAGYYWYSPQGEECYSESDLDEVGYISAPTYLDVWLWLWRKKRIWLQVRHMGNGDWFKCWAVTEQNFSDPEEAIVSAIEYLVGRNLIK